MYDIVKQLLDIVPNMSKKSKDNLKPFKRIRRIT